MISNQFLLPIARELVVDLFAGGSGASTGIEQAIGRHVDIAVNHDPEAVALHTANHPQTRHYLSDVFEVDPIIVTEGLPVGLLWASPDCTFHSKARGGKPFRDRNRARRRRGLAGIVTRWAAAVKPRMIFMENVEEFQDWGPLDAEGVPCKQRKGKSFQRWVAQLRNLGYVVEWQELRACDFGAPTIRKRLFLIARRDGMPIVWPAATHGAPDSLPVRQKKQKPWRTAAECIDWDIAAPSIFERAKPLADATCRRIAKGLMRYVVNSPQPFIVNTRNGERDGQAPRVRSIQEPYWTVTGQGSQGAIAVPLIAPLLTEFANASSQRNFAADEPLRTQVAQIKGGHFALVSAFLAQHNNHRGSVPNTGRSAEAPMSTVTTTGSQQGLVTANLIHMGHGEGKDGKKRFSHGVRDVEQPLNTITASGAPAGLVTSHMVKLRGDNVGSGVDEPLHTISAQGQHHAQVQAFLIKYYGTDQDPSLNQPMHTVTTKARFGLVTVRGEQYVIADIGLRMLSPRELYRAQGFPESFVINCLYNGKPMTKTAQIRMCGNSVSPNMACALVGGNYSEAGVARKVA